MKRINIIALIVIAVAFCTAAFWKYYQWQQRKQVVTATLLQQLRHLGVISVVELRKSKLDADDWNLKAWFRVPEDARIVDVFWCNDTFQFEVSQDRKHQTLNSEQFEEFMRANKTRHDNPY